MTIELPIRTVSESNRHTHWRDRQKRAKQQRGVVRALMRGKLNHRPKPRVVRLVRLAPRELDDDNLAGSFKHIRDEIAALLGFNDRDKSVDWECDQEKRSGDYAIRVEIEW